MHVRLEFCVNAEGLNGRRADIVRFGEAEVQWQSYPPSRQEIGQSVKPASTLPSHIS
ncbi:hypothetical protein [Streptomyces sp. NBC_00353]|uniref:LexA family protein n=1 Tax=unclassified Streptomyces TaxID=2593676 RepID=UPI002E26C9CD